MSHDRIDLYGKFLAAIEKIEQCPEFSSLIPEVRTNLVYTAKKPKGPGDVLGVDGRITVVDGMPRAAGRPRFGVSSHMARFLLDLQRYDGSIRAGINFAGGPGITKWLKEYGKTKGWAFGVIDRDSDPEKVTGGEGASMAWNVSEAVSSAGTRVPKVFYERAAVGKEPLTVLVGRDPLEVAEEICEIARLYAQKKRPVGKIGKIDLETFETFISRRLGRRDETVLVPPLTGVDAGVIDIGDGKVLIIAEDPILFAPGTPYDLFGWYAVHIGASDVAVMGVKPRYMTYTLLMPPLTADEDFRKIVDSIHRTAQELEIAIVGGHTGYYPGIELPLVGGITVFSIADKDGYVTPAGARPGDDILLTKGPAVEAVGLLAVLYERTLREKYPPHLVDRAIGYREKMTVVEDALVAFEAGGVSSMHDATEGGVIGGLFEIANASDVGMEVDEALFIYPEETRMLCEELKIDPVAAIAEGSLLITVDPDYSGKVIGALKEREIAASIIGKVVANRGKRVLKRFDGSIVSLAIPKQDPFWPKFFKGLEGD